MSLAGAIPKCRALQTLRVSGCEWEVTGAAHVVAALPRCPKLHTFDISHTWLPSHLTPPTNWVPLLAAVLPFSTVTSLDVSSCHMRDDACALLAASLAACSLVTLDLSDNLIGREGAEALGRALVGLRQPTEEEKGASVKGKVAHRPKDSQQLSD